MLYSLRYLCRLLARLQRNVIFALMVVFMVTITGCLESQKQEDVVLTDEQVYTTLTNMIAEADSSGELRESCELLSCVQLLAALGMDVIPKEDKWNLNATWEPNDCGAPPDYYIVEVRYAKFGNPETKLYIENYVGGFGIRAYGVTLSNGIVGPPSLPTYSDSTFSGVRFGTVTVNPPDCPEPE